MKRMRTLKSKKREDRRISTEEHHISLDSHLLKSYQKISKAITIVSFSDTVATALLIITLQLMVPKQETAR